MRHRVRGMGHQEPSSPCRAASQRNQRVRPVRVSEVQPAVRLLRGHPAALTCLGAPPAPDRSPEGTLSAGLKAFARWSFGPLSEFLGLHQREKTRGEPALAPGLGIIRALARSACALVLRGTDAPGCQDAEEEILGLA